MESGIIQTILSYLTPENFTALLVTTGIAAWISSVLNSKSSNKFVQFILDVLNLLGGNVFKGKNADDL